jgi:predicted DNA-binding transcriptional regulator YafY
MKNYEKFHRYVFIIRFLRNSRMATFEEIQKYLAGQFRIVGDEQWISQRTFQRDIKEIESLFGIEVECNGFHQYHLRKDNLSEYHLRLLEAFEVYNSLSIGQSLSSRWVTDSHSRAGAEHLSVLFDAIRNNKVVRFCYQKFSEDDPAMKTVKPYGLREFRGRWYLVGLDGRNQLRTYGLDRVSALEETPLKFEFPADFSMADYFRDCYGVTVPNNQLPEEIILSFTRLQGKYINTLPLHHSQEVIAQPSREYLIRLKVFVNFEFQQEIRSYGDAVKVIQPEDLLSRKTGVS